MCEPWCRPRWSTLKSTEAMSTHPPLPVCTWWLCASCPPVGGLAAAGAAHAAAPKTPAATAAEIRNVLMVAVPFRLQRSQSGHSSKGDLRTRLHLSRSSVGLRPSMDHRVRLQDLGPASIPESATRSDGGEHRSDNSCLAFAVVRRRPIRRFHA